MATDGDFECDKITGDIVIGGTVGPENFIADEGITGDLTIGTDDPNDPDDYVTVTGDIDMGRHYDGAIKIHGYLEGDLITGRPGDILIDGPGEHNGNISINNQQTYMGTLRIGDEACEDDPNDPNDAYDPNVAYATMNGDIYIHYGTQGAGAGEGGWIQVFGDMNGSIEIGNGVDLGGTGEEDCWGSIYVAQSLHNDITIHGDLGNSSYSYRPGMIIIGEDLAPADPNAIVPKIKVGKNVLGSTNPNMNPAKIHILGDMAGLIEVDEDLLQGRIYVNGSFLDSVYDPNAPTWSEIAVHGEIDTGGAITIDYDGYDPNDVWDPNAQVLLGAANIITGNEPDEYVWYVTECIGDLDNDEDVDGDDWDLYVDTEADFDNAAPGLLGSRVYHSDGSYNGTWYSSSDPNDLYDPNNDYPYILSLTNIGEADPNICCVTSAFTLPACSTDVWYDGFTNASDLATLLSDYGCTSGCIGDTTGDDDTDLNDLAKLLALYGSTCGCPESARGGRSLDPSECITLSVAAIDTGGYSGGGFSGEVDHFVFDLRIEVDDPNDNDWIVSGSMLRARNDAEFRLSTTSTTPNQYATFVAAPWTSLPGSATANVAGAYYPADPNEAFEVDELNIGWYDTATDSHDGPATVMRIVIDVSDVSGADVSGGFGAVYFAKAKKNASDILLAELDAGACTADAEGAMDIYYGSFFVAGE